MIRQKRITITWRQRKTGVRYGVFYLAVFDLSVTANGFYGGEQFTSSDNIKKRKTFSLLYASLMERLLN